MFYFVMVMWFSFITFSQVGSVHTVATIVDDQPTLEGINIPASSEHVPLKIRMDFSQSAVDGVFTSAGPYKSTEELLCMNLQVKFVNEFYVHKADADMQHEEALD
mmetsp:Transcript_25600/g.39383  ORF Transcript_25600/g.39383 Transcript_25600/m.39383 type:complete len:105 (-) Transcript_25600:1503-1817(-)